MAHVVEARRRVAGCRHAPQIGPSTPSDSHLGTADAIAPSGPLRALEGRWASPLSAPLMRFAKIDDIENRTAEAPRITSGRMSGLKAEIGERAHRSALREAGVDILRRARALDQKGGRQPPAERGAAAAPGAWPEPQTATPHRLPALAHQPYIFAMPRPPKDTTPRPRPSRGKSGKPPAPPVEGLGGTPETKRSAKALGEPPQAPFLPPLASSFAPDAGEDVEAAGASPTPDP